MNRKVLIFLIIGMFFVSCDSRADLPDGVYADIKTNRGKILIQLEYQETPLTVSSFVALAEGKMNTDVKNGPYFNNLTFHRVEPGFVIQGGDPYGNGTGGPGYQFPDEIVPGLDFNAEGIVGMANAGPGTNGSQFFITLAPAPFLTGGYTVFGHVVEGMDVVNAIQVGDRINSVEIIRIGREAEGFQPDQESFDRLRERELARVEREKQEAMSKIENEIKSRWPDAVVTSEGIRFVINKEGTGSKPQTGQTVSVHYRGMFLDGRQFDSSIDRGTPFEFRVGIGQVIPGWDLSVLDMKIGEKRTIILPPDMGYGSRGAGGVIPPDTWLVFDVELLGISQ